MKKLLVGLLMVSPFSAIAGVEVICDTKFTTASADSFNKADVTKINSRIKELEDQGLKVEVTQMSTAISYGISSRPNSSGYTRNNEGGADKVCVVLKY